MRLMTKKILFLLKTPLRWFKNLYNWTIHWAKTKKAPYALFGIAFLESSCFPIPPDVLLIAMVVAETKKWLRYAAICTLGSVLGALLGYFIGWAFYESAGKWIFHTYHLEDLVTLIGKKYEENAFLAIFTAAFTPIPYKAITITAGLFRIPLGVLIAASLAGRAARFFIVAGALRLFGKRIADSIERYFDIFSVVLVGLLILGIILMKFVYT